MVVNSVGYRTRRERKTCKSAGSQGNSLEAARRETGQRPDPQAAGNRQQSRHPHTQSETERAERLTGAAGRWRGHARVTGCASGRAFLPHPPPPPRPQGTRGSLAHEGRRRPRELYFEEYSKAPQEGATRNEGQNGQALNRRAKSRRDGASRRQA